MNESCGEQHARWLELALAEGPGSLDAASLRALEACPNCAPDLREIEALEGMLGSAALEEREDLASITPAELERQRAFVEQVHRMRLAPAAATVRAPRYALWLAAAGVLAALYFWMRERASEMPGGTSPQPDVYLSGDHDLSAQRLVATFGALRWEAGKASASSWQVVATDPSGREVVSERVHGTSFEFDLQETATWPDRIRWTVTPRDMGGRLRPEAAVIVEVARSR